MKLADIQKDPIKNLALGNSIPSEYNFYKYKKENFKEITNEQDNILLLLTSYHFSIIDLTFLLDLDPTNKEIFNYYNQLKDEYHNLVKYYETNYGMLSNITSTMTEKYSYLDKPWTSDTYVDI